MTVVDPILETGPPGSNGAPGPPGPPGPATSSNTRKYSLMDGTANRGYSTPDAVGFALTTGVRMLAMIKPTAIVSGVSTIFLAKWSTTGGTGNRSYDFGIKSDGSLQVNFSTTGGNTVTLNSSDPLSSVVEGTEPVLVQVDLISNDGTGKSQATFYYSTDWGQTAMKQLGTVVTNATPGPFFVGNAAVFVGGTANGSFLFNGRFYYAEIWDISSTPTIVARMDARGLATNTSDYTDTQGTTKTWTHQSAVQLFSDETNGLDMLNGSIPVERLGEVLTDGLTIISSGGKGQWQAPSGGLPGVVVLNADRHGAVDATAALIAALAAVTPSGYGANYEFGAGTVVVPPGVYALSALVQIPHHVDLIGYGMRNTAFKMTAAGGRINFGGDSPFTTPHRGGLCGNFIVDGNNVATLPFSIGNRTQGLFQAIEIRSSAGDGCRLAAGQNNLLSQFNVEFCAGSGLVVDSGWGGNRHDRIELNQNGSNGAGCYNFKMVQTLDVAGIYAEPSDNIFTKGMWERWNQAGAAGNVYIGAGWNNVFDHVNFAGGNMGAGLSKAVITLRRDAGGNRTQLQRFRDCMAQGTKNTPGTGTTFLDALGAVHAIFEGKTYPTTHDVIWRIDDNAIIHIDEGTGASNATYNTLFANQGGGSLAYEECVRQRGRPAVLHAVPTDALVQAFWDGRPPADGDQAINRNDQTKLYQRVGGAWKAATLA